MNAAKAPSESTEETWLGPVLADVIRFEAPLNSITSALIRPTSARMEKVNTEARIVSNKVFNCAVFISRRLKNRLAVTRAKGPARAKATASRLNDGIKKIAGVSNKK